MGWRPGGRGCLAVHASTRWRPGAARWVRWVGGNVGAWGAREWPMVGRQPSPWWSWTHCSREQRSLRLPKVHGCFAAHFVCCQACVTSIIRFFSLLAPAVHSHVRTPHSHFTFPHFLHGSPKIVCIHKHRTLCLCRPTRLALVSETPSHTASFPLPNFISVSTCVPNSRPLLGPHAPASQYHSHSNPIVEP